MVASSGGSAGIDEHCHLMPNTLCSCRRVVASVWKHAEIIGESEIIGDHAEIAFTALSGFRLAK